MTKDEEIALYNNQYCDLPFMALNLVAARIMEFDLTPGYYKFWWAVMLEPGSPIGLHKDRSW